MKRLVVYVTEPTKPYVRSYGNGNVGIGSEHDGSDTHCIRPYCHLIHKITCQLQHLGKQRKKSVGVHYMGAAFNTIALDFALTGSKQGLGSLGRVCSAEFGVFTN